MMTANGERLRQEHEEILELTRILLRVLWERHETPSRVIHLLEALRARILQHFEDEEEADCGFFDRLQHKNAAVAERCATLKADHAAMRDLWAELLNRAQSADGTPAWWSDLEDRFQQLSSRLRNHEHDESQLEQDVFGHDWGGGD